MAVLVAISTSTRKWSWFRYFYYWTKFSRDVKRYIEQCVICLKDKGGACNIGLYKPLPIPKRMWECMSMDFVLGLPKIKTRLENGYVVVDTFNEMSHFIPCKTTHDDSYIAHLFFKEVVRIHRLPLSIVSNIDVKFMSHFWKTLWNRLAANFSFGSTYHPQIDSQNEMINSVT